MGNKQTKKQKTFFYHFDAFNYVARFSQTELEEKGNGGVRAFGILGVRATEFAFQEYTWWLSQ